MISVIYKENHTLNGINSGSLSNSSDPWSPLGGLQFQTISEERIHFIEINRKISLCSGKQQKQQYQQLI